MEANAARPRPEYTLAGRTLTGTPAQIASDIDDLIVTLMALRRWVTEPDRGGPGDAKAPRPGLVRTKASSTGSAFSALNRFLLRVDECGRLLGCRGLIAMVAGCDSRDAAARSAHGPAPAVFAVIGVLVGTTLAPPQALATPSTTYWAPSTASCQARGVPHVTYDTYFWKGPAVGAAGAPAYPIDTGLTLGILPFDKVQAEVGFDLLLPSPDPLYLNMKLCTPEGSLFAGSPALSGGIYNVGFKDDVTDYNVLHLMFQKALPVGGYVAAGLYHGLNRTLLTNSDGDVATTGAMVGVVSPDVSVGLKGLRKFNIAADVQTGKNVLGAWGFGTNIYFADNVSLLVGPVFFLDPDLQPGSSKYMWTAQLDVDLPLARWPRRKPCSTSCSSVYRFCSSSSASATWPRAID